MKAVLGPCVFGIALCACCPPPTGPAQELSSEQPAATQDSRDEAHTTPRASASQTPEGVWLAEVGIGAAQTDRVCARRAEDHIARALCVEPRPEIDSLESLYSQLGLVGEERLIAATTHSLGLSVRTVTAANPRTVVFVNNQRYAPVPYEKLVALSFARGEQLVEMVALDPSTYDWNFYVLAFEQECNQSRCTPSQLLTDSIEQDWTSWTLYSDADLLDTPLDCTSCHQPAGPGTHKLLLMRQLADPWLHWGDFRGVNESANCSQDGPVRDDPGRQIPGEGLDLMLELEGPRGQLAGLPIRELHESKSGRLLADLIVDAANAIDTSPFGSSYDHGDHEFDSARILCELLDSDVSKTWEAHRAEAQQLGLPVAYPREDVMDPPMRAQIRADRAGFLARHEQDDAFAVASSLMSPDVAVSVGVIADPETDAPKLLRQMCVRCHNDATPAGLRRAQFNAEQLGNLDSSAVGEVLDRIRLPRHSARLMPPLRAGELPPAAIDRIERYLKERCGADCE